MQLLQITDTAFDFLLILSRENLKFIGNWIFLSLLTTRLKISALPLGSKSTVDLTNCVKGKTSKFYESKKYQTPKAPFLAPSLRHASRVLEKDFSSPS